MLTLIGSEPAGADELGIAFTLGSFPPFRVEAESPLITL